MSKNREIERRYVVTNVDPAIFGTKAIFIQQYYLSWLLGLRVRLMTNEQGRQTAMLTFKKGRGLSRLELETALPLWLAKILAKIATYSLTKKRYKLHGWEIDFFAGNLSGLILAECELENEEVKIMIPHWLNVSQEVTETVTSMQLARLTKKHPKLNAEQIVSLAIAESN